MATQIPFFSVTAQTADYNSPAVDTLNQAYSIMIVVEGTYNADAVLQQSLDGVNWVDVEGSSESAFSGDPETILFDVTSGFHRFARVAITFNSGSFDVKGFIENGGSYWKAI
jgi:hypothetical protein